MTARTRCLTITGAAAVALILSACTGGTISYRDTPLATAWGESFETARDNQILHPEAAQNLAAVEGLDGPATERALDNYRKSFEKTPPRPIYDIGIGSFAGY